MPEHAFLSQGVDHLGFLNGQLRGMMGFPALANELTQNADDAGAEWLSFDVTKEALIVENSSLFSECGSVESEDCASEAMNGRLCDFHRFRRVSSGNKRQEEDTIGAFGIGFTSVYQITDRPELFCGARHWIIRPEESQDRRIEQSRIGDLQLTRFRLPWARDSESALRRKLDASSISEKDIDRLAGEIATTITDSIMFLKHIRNITLKRDGKPIKDVRITRNGELVEVHNGENNRQWICLEGDFSAEVDESVTSHMVRRRKTEVTIAIPLQTDNFKGLLYAYLPTQQSVGLPFHINADFYPTPDRKHILFDDDYQGSWNRMAIEKAAEVLTDRLSDLTEQLGHVSFWGMIERLQKVANATDAGQYDDVFGSFWEQANNILGDIQCVYTSDETWAYPDDVSILQNYKRERNIIPILEELGQRIVHPDLSAYQNIITSGNIAVSKFSIGRLADALSANGLGDWVSIDDSPNWIQDDENYKVLVSEIEYLLENTSPTQEEKEHIRNCAIAKSFGNNFDTPASIYRAERGVRELFLPLGLHAYFLADDNAKIIADLSEDFGIKHAIQLIGWAESDAVSSCIGSNPQAYKDLMKWLVNECLNENDDTKADLIRLEIWPSNGELYRLDDLVVPGGFTDPLNLASVVDLETLQIPAERLTNIGAKELSFENYISEQLVQKFQGIGEVDPELRNKLVELLARHRSLIVDNEAIRDIVAAFPIIKCQNGEFRPANSIYYSNDETKSLLDRKTTSFIDPPSTYSHEIQELHRWLGISGTPKLEDLVTRVKETVKHPPNPSTSKLMLGIFIHIGKKWNQIADKSALETLKTMKWLTDRNDPSHWYYPDQLYAPYQDYLFSSTGKIIDIPRAEFGVLSEFVEALGIQTVPTVNLVIGHLEHMIRDNRPVNQAVYTFLEQNHEDELVTRLKDTKCVLLPNGSYLSPDKIFWSEHPFGSYRFRLGPEMAKYSNLFQVWGVKNEPEKDDAIAVLEEISQKFSSERTPLDQESQAVVASCWRLLQSAPTQDFESLSSLPVILTSSNHLAVPRTIFIDDSPDVADKLGISASVIPRPEAWRPMQKSGVRFLSEVVHAELITAPNQVEDNELTEKLLWGVDCIVRVVESSRVNDEFGYEINHLYDVRFVKTNGISIRYSLPDLDCSSEVISASAFYDENTQTLYYDLSAGLNGVSRELARSISTQTDAGPLALGIKEVLSSGSLDEAISNLNALGFAIIDIKRSEKARAATITDFGGESQEGENFETEQTEDYLTADESDGHGLEEDDDIGDHTSTDNLERKFGANLGRDLNGGLKHETEGHSGTSTGNRESQSAKDEGHGGARSTPSTGGLTAPGKKSNSRSQKARGRLLSYVENELSEMEDSDGDEVQTKRRQEIDEAGIQKVLEFERTAGRDPDEMLKNVKGYDIKSYDNMGKLVRFIEVKSTSGEWGSYGVKLSDSQFEKAQEEGDRYWLYVVERADLENSKIYCIQNPAAEVTNYCFDQGWKILHRT